MSNNNNNTHNQNRNSDNNNIKKMDVVQKLLNELFNNTDNWESTAESVYNNADKLQLGLDLGGIKKNSTPSDSSIMDYSAALIPVTAGYTVRVDIGRIYGKMTKTIEGEQVTYLGDIYDDDDLHTLIKDTAKAIYSQYYTDTLTDAFADEIYYLVLNILAESLALYSLIMWAWSFQSMAEVKISASDVPGNVTPISFSRLFAQNGFYNFDANGYLPYSDETTRSETSPQFKPACWNISNAEWARKVAAKLSAVRLPRNTAKFARWLFASTHLMKLDETNMTPVFVKFLPNYTTDLDNEGISGYNAIISGRVNFNTADKFFEQVDALYTSISKNLSKYSWLDRVLAALGCNYSNLGVTVDKQFNITFKENDSITRNLAGMQPCISYDDNNVIRDILKEAGRTNINYGIPEEVEYNSARYALQPYECLYNKKTVKVRIFNAIDISVPTEMSFDPTSLSNLLKGNITEPMVHILAQDIYDEDGAFYRRVRLLLGKPTSIFHIISGTTTVSNVVLWQLLMKGINIPEIYQLVIAQAGNPYLTQVQAYPLGVYNMYDAIGNSTLVDIQRAIAARKYLLNIQYAEDSGNKDKSKKDKKKQKKEAVLKDTEPASQGNPVEKKEEKDHEESK